MIDDSKLRPLLVSVAYRMIGSRSDAEDLAQEALLRTHLASQREDIRSIDAFATTIVTRLSIDHLRSARVRRESYVGPWLPEPVSDDLDGDAVRNAETVDSVSMAFLVALEALGPVERAALLLHDVFDYGYAEISSILDRNEAACRQLVARARARVREQRPRFSVDPALHIRLLEQFLDAARGGDMDAFIALLSEDAVVLSDGGAGVKAARFPIVGRTRAARFLSRVLPRVMGYGSIRLATVNGRPGFVVLVADDRVDRVADERVYGAGSIEVADERISALHWVVNPDKLHWVRPD